jgi:allantoin racemase
VEGYAVLEDNASTYIPVVGAGAAVAAVALNLGQRVGVLGIRDEAPARWPAFWATT